MLRIGCSGWQYNHWKGVFYPEHLKKKQWFEWYARHFNTVEVNNTFYNLPEADTFDNWREMAPEDFLFCLKFSRYGSHIKRLKDPQQPVELFTERAGRLKDHLGPVLVQLPPHWNVNVQRLAGFLSTTPSEFRWAVEFRDPSWLCSEVFDVLREHNAALVLHDMLPDHPREITADWVYLRFHGQDYSHNYPHQKLSSVADEIAEHLNDGLDVFGFFNNDAHGYAVSNARDLLRYVDNRSESSD